MYSLNSIPYRDRISAGRWLAGELQSMNGIEDVVVLGVPRGGVIVAAEIARSLRAPMDVFVVRKIHLDAGKRQIGAMASGGVCVLQPEVLRTTEEGALEIADAIARVRDQVLAAEVLFRQQRPTLPVEDKHVILVDDGAATGGSLRAAVAALRSQSPATITVAVPIASAPASQLLEKETEQFVCPFTPDPFYSIGLAYERFPRITDEQARAALEAALPETFSPNREP